ncbi:unnamed protein product [Microthlaspi erraticum]|uniref:Uncharacterized protein n=1 Tax=Microthlaspi erraticum TaxID=1685480 RepID=A0A6D2JIX8_9BRAS|nr:unnamed protein product [Microthlaspi erraticum]
MDFIKTSSLRALIELTFQRNWNGLIWMSRKGVITKRVKTVQTALSRISAQPRSPAGRGTNVPRSAKTVSVRLKSRPKSKPLGRSQHDPGNIVPRSAKPNVTPHAHDQSARAGNKPRGRATLSRTTADASVRAGKNVPRPAENFIGQIHPLDHGRPRIRPTPTVPTRPTTRLSGRSSRTTVPTPRSTRSPFEAQTYVFKPGLTLAASRKT